MRRAAIAKPIEPIWIAKTIAAAAEFFGVSPKTIREDWPARGMPKQAKGHYDLREICAWRIKDAIRIAFGSAASPGAASAPGADPMLTGEGEALERYRLAKAMLAELELAKKREQVIDRGAAHSALGKIAELLRAAGQNLQRRFGPDAAFLLEEAIINAEREVETIFGSGDAGGNPQSDDQ